MLIIIIIIILYSSIQPEYGTILKLEGLLNLLTEHLVDYNGFIAFCLTLQLLFSSLSTSAEPADVLFRNSSYTQVDRIGALERNMRGVTWKKINPSTVFMWFMQFRLR